MKNALVDKKTLPGEGQLAPRLDRTFKSAWRSYRRAFKRCQKKLSRATVHQLRVETRRLLALVDLFDPLLAGEAADRTFPALQTAVQNLRPIARCAGDVVRRGAAAAPVSGCKTFQKGTAAPGKASRPATGAETPAHEAETVEEPDGRPSPRVARRREAGGGVSPRKGSFVKRRGPGVCERGGAPAEHCPDGSRTPSIARALPSRNSATWSSSCGR